MSKQVKNILTTIGVALLILLPMLILMFTVISDSYKFKEYDLSLSEISEDIYASYYQVHSAAPAHNYEVITICSNGNVQTFSGDVNIVFTDSVPHAEVKDYYKRVHGTEITVYIPQNSVKYEMSLTQ